MSDTKEKNLNPLAIFAGFIPWIVFAIVASRLAADGVAWSALLAAAIGVVFIVYNRRTGGPTQMDIYSVVLFGVIAVVGFIGDHAVDDWLYQWGRPLVGVILGLTLLATSPVRPFTAEYAKRSTPREFWDSPLFRRINLVLSAAWGVVITLIGVSSVLVTVFDAHPTGTDSAHLVDFFLNWAIPIVLIVWMVHFTNSYPDRARDRYLAGQAAV
ncbi:hypothetical protein GYA93_11105 [Gordonia desulfuricans]|uniref:DUF3159 domain-containing protein n=1 Tax=Gordonia desulfuricans TaxID=89051 RepID=A0A7K3LRF0_9ACTN|nr:hypothetical protein [Gordonia desulfuricans]NDK90127.1 hypothetical protein [Gordonia desulfuricans]